MSDIKMCWVDMETTGLEALHDVPLELGIVLTDRWGKMIDEKSWLIWEEDSGDFILGVQRGKANKFVNPMHEQSGLWLDLLRPDTKSRDEVDAEVVEFLSGWGVDDRSLAMAGNSVGSLDRPFTLVHFPKLNQALNYRNIDMSSIKEVMKLTNPILFEQLSDVIGNKENATHRVLDDCHAAIIEYGVYIEEFLLADPEADLV